jgi:hypothetical protein
MHKLRSSGACRIVNDSPAKDESIPSSPRLGTLAVPGRNSRCIFLAKVGRSLVRQNSPFATCMYACLVVLFDSPHRVGPVPWALRRLQLSYLVVAVPRFETAGQACSTAYIESPSTPLRPPRSAPTLIRQLLLAPYLDVLGLVMRTTGDYCYGHTNLYTYIRPFLHDVLSHC